MTPKNPSSGVCRSKSALLSMLAMAFLVLALTPVQAQEDDQHTLNLNDVEIQVLISTVSEITGQNFIVDPRVTGNVRVVSARPMSAEEIYQVFLSVLKVNGYAAVPEGAVTRIVPDDSARQDAWASGNAPSPNDLVTRMIPVQHVAAAELVPLLTPLLPQQSHLVAHEPSNTLIVSDRAANVDRIRSIVSRIDQNSGDEVEVIGLTHANAAEVVRTINSLSPAGSGQQRAIADARTNTVLLGGDAGGRLRIRSLIAALDTPLDNGGDTQVVYLRYADAQSLVPILQNISAQELGGAGNGAAPSGGETVIQAHADTNSLVIAATPAVFRTLQSVIRKLDVRRAQVMVEAIIAEVSIDLTRRLGVQWQASGVDNINDSGVIGGTSFRDSGNSSILDLTSGGDGLLGLNGLGSGLNVGYLSGVIEVSDGAGGTVSVPQIGALVSALSSDANTNLISTPSIVTLDHQEAVIQVGQEVPFLTGQFTNTGTAESAVNPFQTIQREDVGLTLTVTPHINEGDTVILDLNQEISSLSPSSSAVDLITNKRTLTTSVMVPNQGMLVLGGLIDEDVQETIQKVPGLGDIPVVGNLFRFRSTSRLKRNLMIFIRPRILEDEAVMRSVTAGKYNFMRQQELEARENNQGLLRDEDLPLLPELMEEPQQ